MRTRIFCMDRVCHTLLALLLAVSSIHSGPVIAQSDELDIEGPTIEHEVLDSGYLGNTQVFSATVVDNQDVQSVQLFYRFDAEESFVTQNMTPVAASAVYTTSIETKGSDAAQIEYYIQAEDTAGNIVLEGYTFSPLVRSLKPHTLETQSESKVANNEVTESTPPPEKKSRLLWYALGVLLVGGVAAAASGGSGQSDNSGAGTTDTSCCTVDLNLTPP